MTKEEITEHNTLIAQFMGMKRHSHASYVTWENEKKEHIFESTLQYNTSIEWLMPVVEKIAEDYTVDLHSFPGHGFSFTIKEGNFRRGYGDDERPIKAIFYGIVDFIKSYHIHK